MLVFCASVIFPGLSLLISFVTLSRIQDDLASAVASAGDSSTAAEAKNRRGRKPGQVRSSFRLFSGPKKCDAIIY